MNPILILIVFFLAMPLFGQTKVPGNRDYSGTQNFTGATMRVPNGNANPGTCATGDMFILNTATSGRRVHVCEAGTWVLQGGGADTNTTTSADGELTLFADTSGKLFKRAAGTGYVKAASGVAAFSATIPQADVVNLTTDLTARVLTTRQVATGDGLTGGGDLSSNRTISLNINALTEKITPVPGTDWIPIYDEAGTAHKKTKWPNGGGIATSISTTASLPGTCTVGDVRFNTADAALYACTATNTWTKQLGSGDGTVQSAIVLKELSANGENTFSLTAPTNIATDIVLEAPDATPTGVLYANAGKMAVATGANIGAAFSGPGEYLKKDGSSGTPSGTAACIPAGSGGFYFPLDGMYSVPTYVGDGVPSKVVYHAVTLPCPLTFGKIRFRVGIASGTCGGTCGATVAILNSSRARIWQSPVMTSGGTPDLNVVGVKEVTFTQTTLQPGVYYIGFISESASMQILGSATVQGGLQLFGIDPNHMTFQTATQPTGAGATWSAPANPANTFEAYTVNRPVLMFME